MFEYFPGNYAWNLAALTLIEDVGTISEPAAAFAKAAPYANAEPGIAAKHWFAAMSELGTKLEKLGDADVAENRPLSAARKYYRSSMYLIRAERMASHEDPARLAAYKRAIANFRKFCDLGQQGVEFIDIPYGDGFIPALFVPAVAGTPSPLVIQLQGFDSIKETQFPILLEYRRRGISSLIVDQPGAGGALRLYDLKAEVETERYVGTILDFIESRPDMATDQIGITGLSMGGYFAPRAAANDSRIKACACWGAFFSWPDLFRSRAASHGESSNSPVPAPAVHGMWAWGASSPEELAEKYLSKLTLEGIAQKLTCPLLVLHGEGDRQVPVQQAIETFEKAGSEDKRLKIFTPEEGGIEHCQIDNRRWAVDLLADWYQQVFSNA